METEDRKEKPLHHQFTWHFLWFFLFLFCIAFGTLFLLLALFQPFGPIVKTWSFTGISLSPAYLIFLFVVSIMIAGTSAFLYSLYKFSHHV